MLIAISAMTKNHVIGTNNTLPRHIPEDLKRFKELTVWHTVVMGRKTYESLPEEFRPLPNRHNIVISRSRNNTDTCISSKQQETNTSLTLLSSIDDFLIRSKNHETQIIFIIWWSQIYHSLLPYYDFLHITEIKWEYEWDVYFPSFSEMFEEIKRESHNTHDFAIYKKIGSTKNRPIV